MKEIKRGNITYRIFPDRVVVGLGLNQWISYNPYENWNRQGITQFREKLLKSKEDEYATPTDLMTLAHKCKIVGSGASAPGS